MLALAEEAERTVTALRHSRRTERFLVAGLLLFAALHHLINFLFDGFKIERGRLLHRRIIDRRLRQLEVFLLHENEALELTSIETVRVTAAQVVQGLPAKRRVRRRAPGGC